MVATRNYLRNMIAAVLQARTSNPPEGVIMGYVHLKVRLIQDELKELGWKLDDLAGASGVDSRTLKKLLSPKSGVPEGGRNNPRCLLRTAKRIGKTLFRHDSECVYEEEIKDPPPFSPEQEELYRLAKKALADDQFLRQIVPDKQGNPQSFHALIERHCWGSWRGIEIAAEKRVAVYERLVDEGRLRNLCTDSKTYAACYCNREALQYDLPLRVEVELSAYRELTRIRETDEQSYVKKTAAMRGALADFKAKAAECSSVDPKSIQARQLLVACVKKDHAFHLSTLNPSSLTYQLNKLALRSFADSYQRACELQFGKDHPPTSGGSLDTAAAELDAIFQAVLAWTEIDNRQQEDRVRYAIETHASSPLGRLPKNA